MGFVANEVYDDGLNELAGASRRVDLCSQEPATYTEATSTHSLGNATGVEVGNPGAGSPNGRQVAVPSVSDGSVSAGGEATHWAVSVPGNTWLGAANTLSSGQQVTQGNTFSLTGFSIRIPGPA